MFIVIADDLSGAAELAGIGLQFGLDVEIKSEFTGSSDADLLVINTRTRILDTYTAFLNVRKATAFISTLTPQWIYKKTDSVLRGNILAEIKAIFDVTSLKKCLLIPANPGLGRTIVDSKYLINNLEITNTSFAQDPDYPCETSDVMNLLGEFENVNTAYLRNRQILPSSGVFIGEIENESSLEYWADQINEQILPAGAAEFFSKILQNKGYTITEQQAQQKQEYGKTLFICGSTHQNSRIAVEKARQDGAEIFYIPEKLLLKPDNNLIERWKWEINSAFKKSDKIILAVTNKIGSSKELARTIQNVFSRTVALLLLGMNLDTLVIEGGETAQEITKRLKINCFFPKKLLAAGVVELSTKIENPSKIVIKPGSYKWPESLWRFI